MHTPTATAKAPTNLIIATSGAKLEILKVSGGKNIVAKSVIGIANTPFELANNDTPVTLSCPYPAISKKLPPNAKNMVSSTQGNALSHTSENKATTSPTIPIPTATETAIIVPDKASQKNRQKLRLALPSSLTTLPAQILL